MVVLDEFNVNTRFGKPARLPCLHEKTPVIAKDLRLDYHHIRNPCRHKLHNYASPAMKALQNTRFYVMRCQS